MKITTAIFDMDGLMFDTESLFRIVHEELARKYGTEFTIEMQNKMMGKKPLEAIELMIQELGLPLDPKGFLVERDALYVELLKTRSETMPGLFELLDFLDSKGVRRGMATSSIRPWVDILLDRFDLRKRFDAIATGEDAARGKPEPDIYLKALYDLKAKPEETIALEDALNGVRAAKAAGCFAIAVPNAITAHQDFSVADLVASSLSDPRIRSLIG